MAAISGVGAWYPEPVRENSAWPEDFGARGRSSGDRTFNDIPYSEDPALRVTDEFLLAEASDPFLGVHQRRFAPVELTAAEAETAAARLALEDAGLRAEELSAVISYSAVPDRITPPSASDVASKLGLPRILSWGMDAACATAILQLQTAAALVDSGQYEHVLLTQSHLMLRTFPLLHPASPGLGDASTALIVSRTGRFRILGIHAVTETSFFPAVTWIREAHDDNDSPWWTTGSPFRVGSLDKEGAKALQRDTVAYGVSTLRECVERANLKVEDIGLLACAQPRGWIPRAILRVLSLDEAKAASVYETRGHLGACGAIANLENAYRAGRTEGQTVVALYAQGAGFTRAAALLRDEAQTAIPRV